MNKGKIENLIQYNGQTPEIARENGRKGGLASGVAKRQRKLLRELLNDIMPREVTDEELRIRLEQAGLEPTHEVALCLAVIMRAEKGDVDAARFIRDTRGEKPVESLAVGQLLDVPLQYLDMSRLSDDELRALAYQLDEPDALPEAQ